jgi:hypothetical protein
MNGLISIVRAIIWAVILTLMLSIAGVCLYAAFMLVRQTDWNNFTMVCRTIGILFVFIVLTLIVGGFILWAIREHILPLSPEEQKELKQKEK